MPRNTNSTLRVPATFEHLEPRVMLAGDPLVGLIGFVQDAGGIEGFAIDGSVADDGTVTGSESFINSSGAGADMSPFITGIAFNNDGGFTPTFESGITANGARLGAGALGSGGLGWFYGEESGTQSFGLFVERPMTDNGLATINGQYNVGFFRFDLSGGNDLFGMSPMAADFDGTLSLANGQGTFLATNLDGANPFVQSIALTSDGSGVFTGSDGTLWFSNSDGTALIFIDLTSADQADGFIIMGVALREPTQTLSESDLTGNVYRIAEVNAASSGGDLDSGSMITTAVRLDGGGVARFLDTTSLDAGVEVVTSTGQWALAQGRLVIFNSDDDFVEIVLGQDGSDGVADFFFPIVGSASSRFGVVTLNVPDPDAMDPVIPPPPTPTLVSVVQPDGTIFIQDPTTGNYTQSDIFTASGSSLTAGNVAELISMRDEVTGETSVFLTTNTGEAFVFSLDPNGIWTERNLTSELVGATTFAGEVAFYTRPDETSGPAQASIAGIDPTGDFVLYRQTGATNGSGDPVWEFVNITDQFLTPFAEPTPDFVGSIVGFAPAWGAQHIAGIDATGDLIVLWTAPGQNRWFVTNLSDITGVGDLQGNVTTWVQPWGGLNIAALDASGDLIVHWWTPGFGGNWVASDLSSVVGTSQNSLAGFGTRGFIADDGSAILVTVREDVGAAAGDESLLIFRWDFATDTWTTQIVNSTPSISVPVEDLAGFINDDGDLVILGSDVDGDASAVTLASGASLFTLLDLDAAAVVV